MAALTLRAHAPWRVLDGFGRSVRAACRYANPATVAELEEVLARARGEGLSVAFRGGGRSYGDAALNGEGLVVDASKMNRMLSWDPVNGVAEAEGGLTIEGLWRRTLGDGWWPAVVPGTMLPTLAGCLSMNIHGKNNFRVGPFGDHVLDFDLLTPEGALLRCSRDENADVFHAAIGGLGLLGAITRVRLQLKRVESGLLRVVPIRAASLDVLFDQMERRATSADYLVAWVDCIASGRALGRGLIHEASYITREEDPDDGASLLTEWQGLPRHILGFPKDKLWRFLRPALTNVGMRFVNAMKMFTAWRGDRRPYLQSHVAFAFLLDYIPDWRLAYDPGGLIQHQVFAPAAVARDLLRELLRMSHDARLPPYLGVLKRHRPDDFLLSHGLDGYSLAMDFRVTRENRARLWALAQRMTDRVLDAGGKFYFAKDAVLTAEDVERAYGGERLDRFFAMKARLDPQHVLVSDLGRRAFGERAR
ncbi:MAG: FAD-binding protein [Polyangiaceae bacterium]